MQDAGRQLYGAYRLTKIVNQSIEVSIENQSMCNIYLINGDSDRTLITVSCKPRHRDNDG